jgi:hypothetical protein
MYVDIYLSWLAYRWRRRLFRQVMIDDLLGQPDIALGAL